MPRAPGGRDRHPPVLKKFGQHFLSDETILTTIVDALGPTSADTVVEIGPGRGSLTDILSARSGRVVAVEIDRALVAQLRDKYSDRKTVEIVEGDFLETDLRGVAGEAKRLTPVMEYANYQLISARMTGDGWALVVPDPEEPVTHVWAEGRDHTASEGLVRTFAARVEQVVASS